MRKALIIVVALAMTLVAAVAATADDPKSAKMADRESALASVATPLGERSVRVWGDSRFDTAVAISQEMGWDQTNTSVVFLATGYNYPDALAAGPSALGYGPLLLTLKNSLPPATAKELERLRPCQVIALGGAGAISDAVILAADAYTVDCPA